MGEEIAKMYATLGVKDDTFKKGLNNAKGLLDKVNNSSLGKVTQQLTGFNLTSLSAAGAVTAIISEVSKAVNETVTYNSTIKDTARLIGLNVEETSRLVQASDDLFISQESLKSGLQAATRQGIDVSVEGLKKLSEEYLALDPKQERGTFLMKKFGRSGADMGKLLEVGASGIDKAMNSIEDGLIVTEESIKKTDEYKRNIDNLNDSFTALKMNVGNDVIPILNSFISTEKDANKIEEQNIKTQIDAIHQAKGRGIATKEMIDQLNMLESTLSQNKANRAWTDNLNAQAEAYKAAHLQGGYYDEKLNELKISADTLAASFKPLTNEIIYNTLAATLDAQGQLDLARHLGLINEQAYNASMQLAGLTTIYDTNRDGVIDVTERTNEYYDALNKVTKTAGTYYWNFVVRRNDVVAPAPPSGYGNPANATPHASGGSFVIPMSYGNEGFRLGNGDTASGGERLTVTPKGQQSDAMTKEEYQKTLRDQAKVFGEAMANKLAQLGVIR